MEALENMLIFKNKCVCSHFKKKFNKNRNLKKNMNAIGFQQILRKTFMPFVKKLYPYGHRLIMDNCKSPTAFSTRIFMLAENINNFQSPSQSSVSYI